MYIHAVFGFKRIWAKVKSARAFCEKYDFFDSISILIALEHLSDSREKIMRSKNSPPKP